LVREIVDLGGVSVESIPRSHKVYIARFHDADNDHGSEWKASIIFEVFDGVAYGSGGLSGDNGEINQKKFKSVMSFLKSKGAYFLKYSKIKNGKLREYTLKIS
jgi:hypothetical protein